MNGKLHHRIHNSLPLYFILNPLIHSVSVSSILILSSNLLIGLPRRLLPSSYVTETFDMLLIPVKCDTFRASLILLDFINVKSGWISEAADYTTVSSPL
jgi:hypothetical protein